jgi:hypothetical protein
MSNMILKDFVLYGKKNQTLFYNDNNFVELGDIKSEARSGNMYVLIPRFVPLTI